ncbi:MAG: fimbrillin family protein [Paraprevotella sp.]|nr:fimbrillin family protein [Paraprevotella sp.]
MKRSALYTIVATLAMCMACSENDVAGGGDANQGVRVPIRLGVGNLVELQTRGTDAGMQNATLAPGASVGIFVMDEREYDSLRTGSSYRNASYHYDNVECRLDADGTLQPTGLAEMFYPMEQETKIAVFAYAPYDEAVTRESLLLPEDGVCVSADQSSDDVVLENDLLLGTPVTANPLRMPVSDYSSAPYKTESIRLNLRHQRCRIVLDLKFRGTPELLDGQPFFHADSVLVYAVNVPMSVPSGCTLDDGMENYAVADSILPDTLLMAAYTDVHVGEGQEMAVVATGIVLPCQLPVEPSFCIVMVSGNERRYIRRKVSSPVVMERGTSVSFRTTVEAPV